LTTLITGDDLNFKNDLRVKNNKKYDINNAYIYQYKLDYV